MASDAHVHPQDLLELFPGAEEERRRFRVPCAASAWNREEFEAQERLAKKAEQDGVAPMALCFAVHPQLAASSSAAGSANSAGSTGSDTAALIRTSLEALETLAAENRITAVGETGFDLYNEAFRGTEAVQEELFRRHLETALEKDLPLVLHVRRAMHKIFAYAAELRRLRAVVFHSYPGTLSEGGSLLKRGINAYFSFGNAILLNHKAAMAACARLPPERLLTETDAPYQGRRGEPYSHWADLPLIIRAAAALRHEAGSPAADPAELEEAVDGNFKRVYG
ncbi:MAG: TatD family hydrolase [Treponema sp.]|jgi:TatD DNase family protein|nr:TatD family hydrolase [Treponema sp.]